MNLRFYTLFHSVLGLFALFLSFKCNSGIEPFDLGFACCCPHIYIIYVMATKGLNFCF